MNKPEGGGPGDRPPSTHKKRVLAIEKTFIAKNRNVALLNVLTDEIVLLAERQGLDVVAVAPSSVKKRVTGNGRATKREVAEAVAAIYPELRAYLPNGRTQASPSFNQSR